MQILDFQIPITSIPLTQNIQLFIKREDKTHPEISGNKYWKMFFNVKNYLEKNIHSPLLITFGGAFSNHIAAAAAVGKKFGISTMGIIRGEELENNWQENPTLQFASKNGMIFRFVTREAYRDKEKLSKELQKEFQNALVVPEGGTNEWAVQGIQHMLDERTQQFDYLCSAMGTGGTLSGLSKFAEAHQKVLGFKAVNDESLAKRVLELSGKSNFEIFEAHEGKYGKITDENIRFINEFYRKYRIPLDPIYTGKMMKKLMELIHQNYFPEGSKILAFHTGGLQGILGANALLKKQNRETIKVEI